MYIWKLQSSGLFGRTARIYLKNRARSFTEPLKNSSQKFANEVREKAANTGNAPRQIVFNAQIDLPLYAAPTIPSYPTSLRSINRIRQQALETMPKPKNLDSVDEIPEALKLSHSSDTFLYFDSGKSDSRILVFATLPALDLLSQSEICHCDGTFSVAPDVFYQIYTIHGVIENAVIPLVYALLPNKTQNTYENFFGCLEQFEKKVVIDFEAAVRNAIKKCSLIQKSNSLSSPRPSSMAQGTKTWFYVQVHGR